jgi:hypothetical protein
MRRSTTILIALSCLCAIQCVDTRRASPPQNPPQESVNVDRSILDAAEVRDVREDADGLEEYDDPGSTSQDASSQFVQSSVSEDPETPGCPMNPRIGPNVELPIVPDEIKEDVRRYRFVAARAARCFKTFRIEHVVDQVCRRAASELIRGGRAAMHGLGQFAYDQQNGRLSREEVRAMESSRVRYYSGGRSAYGRGRGTVIEASETLVPVMSQFAEREVVPYVLAMLYRYAHCASNGGDHDTEHYVLWLSVLPAVTGWDLTPLLPWQSYERLAREGREDLVVPERDEFGELVDERMDEGQMSAFGNDAYLRWLRWYRAHRNETLEQWRAEGLSRARRALSEQHIPSRIAAIMRFAQSGASAEDREAARRSLVRLLNEGSLSQSGRRYMRSWASSVGWSLERETSAPDAG